MGVIFPWWKVNSRLHDICIKKNIYNKEDINVSNKYPKKEWNHSVMFYLFIIIMWVTL